MGTLYLAARFIKQKGQKGGRVQYFRANQPDGGPLVNPNNGREYGGNVDITKAMEDLDDKVKLSRCRTQENRFFLYMDEDGECVIIITGPVPTFDDFQFNGLLAPGVRCLFTVVGNELIDPQLSVWTGSKTYLLSNSNRDLVYEVLETFSGVPIYKDKRRKLRYPKYEFFQLVYRICFRQGYQSDIVRNPRMYSHNAGGFTTSDDGSVSILSDTSVLFSVVGCGTPRIFNSLVSITNSSSITAPFSHNSSFMSPFWFHSVFDAILYGLRHVGVDIPANIMTPRDLIRDPDIIICIQNLMKKYWLDVSVERFFLEDVIDSNAPHDIEGGVIDQTEKERTAFVREYMVDEPCVGQEKYYQCAGVCNSLHVNMEVYVVDLINIDVAHGMANENVVIRCSNKEKLYYGAEFPYLRIVEIRYPTDHPTRYHFLNISPERAEIHLNNVLS